MKKKDPILDALALVGDLPTLPIVAIEVARLLEDPSTNPKQITEVMKADQAITTKVLKLVNSPYYAIRGGVSTIEKAIRFLGYNTIYQILIGVSVMEFSRLGGDAGMDMREFWKHSLGVAVASEIIGERAGFADPRELFAAGLLHDLGKLGLAKMANKKFSEAVAQAHKNGIPIKQAEKELGLPAHDRVGGVLAEKWRLPMALRAAISMHHLNYQLRMTTVSRNLQPEVDAVILANTICKRNEIGDSGDLIHPDLDRELIERLGLIQNDLEQIKGEMARKVEQSKVFLDLLGADV
ncbi:MAG: HDOD domain-containing protein [Deltaproteobacteria bacterium]|nr:HDOD domain-containing protein [Deltaproteobacteria bacterium]